MEAEDDDGTDKSRRISDIIEPNEMSGERKSESKLPVNGLPGNIAKETFPKNPENRTKECVDVEPPDKMEPSEGNQEAVQNIEVNIESPCDYSKDDQESLPDSAEVKRESEFIEFACKESSNAHEMEPRTNEEKTETVAPEPHENEQNHVSVGEPMEDGEVNCNDSSVDDLEEDYEDIDGGAMRKAAASKQTLHEAALHNNVERIRILLQLKADVNAKDKAGYTPLFYALRFKKDELTITLLIQAGADINGTYALHDVAGGDSEESVKVAQLLLDSGADVAAVDLAGRTPLFYAAERGTSGMVELLLQHQSPIYVLDKRKETPLCVALRRKNMDILSLIFGEHHVQIFQEDYRSKVAGLKTMPLEDLQPIEEKKATPISTSSASAPNLRDLRQPSGLEHFFSEHSLKYADDVDSSQRNSYVESNKSQASVNTTKHKRQVSFHTMSEIIKDKNLEQPTAIKKKHRRKLSQDLRNELGNAREEAVERGKAAGSRLKRKSKQDQLDLYIELIENECLLHRTVSDIKACLRLGLGPNKTTQAVVDVIDGDCCCQRICNGVFNKPIQSIRDNFHQVTTSVHFSYAVFFLLPLFLYYSDMIVDIVLASQLNTGSAIIVISWILVLVPFSAANTLLFLKRKSLITKDLSEFNAKSVYDVPRFKSFLVFYNTFYLAILLTAVQGWPGLLLYQSLILMLHLKKPYPLVDQVTGHFQYIVNMHTQLFRWSRLVEDTLQLVLQLCVALNLGRISSVLTLKLLISCVTVSYGLVREEMIVKSPAKISYTGSTLLFLCFAFRFLHRIICIALFVRFLTYWTIFVFLIHIAMVLCLQKYDQSVYSPKDSAFTLDRVVDAALSIFHYIPQKTYEHSTPSITRALFLASILVEDFIMFFIAYLYREEVFVHVSVDYIMIVYLGIVTLFALISSLCLAAYYKYGHPWKWRTQRCCLE